METLRLLAIVEPRALVVGPSKTIFDFACLARHSRFGRTVETTFAQFHEPGDHAAFSDASQAAGIRIVDISKWDRWNRKVVAELRDVVREVRPHIIQTHALLSHFVVRFSGLHRQAPWVAFHHGYTWPDLRTRLYNQADRWSLRAAARVVTSCDAFREQLRERGIAGNRIAVVHNAIDPEWGSGVRCGAGELRKRLGVLPEEKVILSVGRLSREKDHVTAVEAFARLHHAGARVRMFIVGDGPERKRIEARIGSLGLRGHIILLGRTSSEPYYGVADAFVLPSRSEGWSLCLLEAMATQVPIVATRVGGVAEMVTHGESALLVAPKDSAALASALLELLRNPDLGRSLTAKAKRLVSNQCTIEARTRQMIDLYCDLLHESRASRLS